MVPTFELGELDAPPVFVFVSVAALLYERAIDRGVVMGAGISRALHSISGGGYSA